MLKIETVLCPVDFTPLSERAVRLAAHAAQRLGARLVLEHNLDAGPPAYLTVSWMWSGEHPPERSEEETACRRLQRLMAGLPADLPREAKLSRGAIEEGLLFLARSLPADLLVMGSHGASDAEHRSVTERILAGAPCPVLTTTEERGEEGLFTAAPTPGQRLAVLVPFDFSPRAHNALAYAWGLADLLPLAVHLLYVTGGGGHLLPGSGDAALERQVAQARLAAELPAERAALATCHVASGTPSEEITRLAAELPADLILMGVRPKGLFRRLATGATAFEVLRADTCPVLFVPAESHGRQGGADGESLLVEAC